MSSHKIMFLIFLMAICGINSKFSKFKNKCYKCVADAKMGPCADPFQLYGRKHFQEDCESDWCVKLEVGAFGRYAKNYIGTGHFER